MADMSNPLTPEQEANLRVMQAAVAEMLAKEAALSPEELAAIKEEWRGFRDKVESGAVAGPVGEPSRAAMAILAWEQEQARRGEESRGR